MNLNNIFPSGRVLPLILYGFFLLLILAACNLEKTIEVPLPPYTSMPVVECYLEPGQPYRLSLAESSGYFDAPSLPLIDGARVVIRYGDQQVQLRNAVQIDTAERRFFNYVSDRLVPETEGLEFSLEVEDRRGRKLNATARTMPRVPIDTVEWKFNRDTLANLLIKFQDTGQSRNYYRLIVHRGRLSSSPEVNFVLTDQLLDGRQIVVGTAFRYRPKDTVTVSLYHIENAFYNFIQSSESSARANGNPFAQPGLVVSNIDGGLGIFTVLSRSRKRLELPANPEIDP
jgi:hypothetical protein